MTASFSQFDLRTFLVFFFALVVSSASLSGQNSEWFVEIDPDNVSFEIVSPIDGLEMVWRITPGFSDELGQYTLLQGQPENALITIDIDNGDILNYAPQTNLPTVQHLIRISEDRILGIANLGFTIGSSIFEMDMVTGGDITELVVMYNEGWGSTFGPTPFAFDDDQNLLIVQYASDYLTGMSKLLVFDVETGTVISDGIVNFYARQLYYHSGEQRFLGVFQEAGPYFDAGNFAGWVDLENEVAIAFTDTITGVSVPESGISGSLDESGERILYTRYGTYSGSSISHLSYANNTLTNESFVLLESDNDPDELISFNDSSRNVLNGYYSNIRNTMFGVHWGRITSSVSEDEFITEVDWRLHTETQAGRFRISGLRVDLPKIVEVHDAGGRGVLRKEENSGETVEVQIQGRPGLYIITVFEGLRQKSFKVVKYE